MIKRNDTNKNTNTKRLGTYILFGACTVMLASGFFFAARQHFSSMDYGMKNSRLRRQIDQLEAEKRRLVLAREISLSPTEVKKSAKKVGLLDAPAIDGRVISSADPMDIKAAAVDRSTDKHLVVKTAAVSSAQNPVTASFKKIDKVGNESKKLGSAE